MFKLLKRLNAKEVAMIIASVAFICAQVEMELEIPS